MNHAWLLNCRDTKDGAERRATALDAHLAYIESVMDDLLIAGPVHDKHDRVSGSYFIYEVADRDQALELLRGDPYHQAGVWESVDCARVALAAGRWIGGASWTTSQSEPS